MSQGKCNLCWTFLWHLVNTDRYNCHFIHIIADFLWTDLVKNSVPPVMGYNDIIFFSITNQYLYVTIACKQLLLPTKAVQFVYWYHNGRADPVRQLMCLDVPYHCDVNTRVCWHAWICPTIMTSIHSLSRKSSMFSNYWDIQELSQSYNKSNATLPKYHQVLCELSPLCAGTSPVLIAQVNYQETTVVCPHVQHLAVKYQNCTEPWALRSGQT